MAISIHALLAESDAFLSGSIKFCKVFLSTLSLRRATCNQLHPSPAGNHFYPRSPCGERRIRAYQRYFALDISIHALLAESDIRAYQRYFALDISIHALLAESDLGYLQGTPHTLTISIHALLAESDKDTTARQQIADIISIHALLAESDSKSAQNSGALLRI